MHIMWMALLPNPDGMLAEERLPSLDRTQGPKMETNGSTWQQALVVMPSGFLVLQIASCLLV